MKRVWAGCLGVILVSGVCLAADRLELKDETDRMNYSIGYQIGGDFQQQGWKINPEVLTRGIQDAINRNTPLMSPEQMNAALVNMKKTLLASQKDAAMNADAAFLKENARKKGVVVLPSGVQYSVLKDGVGKQPTINDSVTIKYRLSRVDRQPAVPGNPGGEPKTYALKKTLPGLREALLLMKEGAIWQVVLPPGPRMGSRGEALESAGVLIYELELVSVQPGS